MSSRNKQIDNQSNQESSLVSVQNNISAVKSEFAGLSTRELRKTYDEMFTRVEGSDPHKEALKEVFLVRDKMRQEKFNNEQRLQALSANLNNEISLERKLLAIITKTRCFFIEDREAVVFDTHTCYFWPFWFYLILEPDPEKKRQDDIQALSPKWHETNKFQPNDRLRRKYEFMLGNTAIPWLVTLKEYNNFKGLKTGTWCGISNWRIPYSSDYQKSILSDPSGFAARWKKFDLCRGAACDAHFRQNSSGFLMYETAGELQELTLSGSGMRLSEIQDHSTIIPVNTSFSPGESYLRKTPQKPASFLLDLFVKHDFLPSFEEGDATTDFRTFFQLRRISEELASRALKTIAVETAGFKSGYRISSEEFFVGKDLKAINDSAIHYCLEGKTWLRYLLEKVDWTLKSVETQLLGVHQSLSSLQNEALPPQGIPELEVLLDTRRTSLHDRLSFGAAHLRNHLNRYLEEVLALERKALQAAESDKQLWALAEVENRIRPTFKALVDQTTAFVNKGLEQIDWVIANQSVISRMLELHQQWRDDALTFCRNGKNALLPLAKDGIEAALIDKWFEEWKTRRVSIEALLLQLFDGSMAGIISLSTLNSASENLQKIKEEIDGFFPRNRSLVYTKFAFQAGGNMQETLEVEKELFSKRESFEASIETLIFSLENSDERLFLLRWGKSFFSSNVESICHLAEVSTPDNGTSPLREIIRQFRELEKSNLEVAIRDAQTFAQILKDRNNQLHSLLFQMRKTLATTGNAVNAQ
ncbi:MAG: hypothetical protein HQM09_21990 [Candidatus Riflebacteria bacterium]|nr:hypothetical protein [Candidatus Riflebacteria bacterium]